MIRAKLYRMEEKQLNYRFYNARLLTMAADKLTEGELWVQGGRIVYVGDGSDADSIGSAVKWEIGRAHV